MTPTEWERSQVLVDGTRNRIGKGYIFNDVLTINHVSVSNLSMGISYESGVSNGGVLGLGYGGNETKLPRDNLAIQLVTKGLITTESYSIWLNADDAKDGSLLFGAIDTTKYAGNLTIIDFFNSSGEGSIIWLSSLEATSPSGTDVLSRDFPIPVGFLFGSPYTILPSDIAQHMWAIAGAEYRSDVSRPVISCTRHDSAGSYRFRFGGPNGPLVNVPLANFLWPPERTAALFEELDLAPEENVCIFSILNSTRSSRWRVGENFLRATYLVVDFYNQEVAMASEASYNVTESDIVAFVAHGAQVPRATYAKSQPTEKPGDMATTTFVRPFTTSTYAAAAGFASLTSSATSPPVGMAFPQGGRGLERRAKIGIGVGVPLGVILLGLLGFACWRYVRSQRLARCPPGGPQWTQPVSELPPKQSSMMPELPAVEVSTINQRSPAELSPRTSPGLSSMGFSGPSEGHADIHAGQRSDSITYDRNIVSQSSDYASELGTGTDHHSRPPVERSSSSRTSNRWSFIPRGR